MNTEVSIWVEQLIREAAHSPEARAKVCESGIVSSIDKSDPRHSLLKLHSEMLTKGEPADFGAVYAHIERLPEDIRGRVRVCFDKACELPATTQLPWYIDQVRFYFLKQRAAEDLADLSSSCMNGSDPAEIVERLRAIQSHLEPNGSSSDIFEDLDVLTAIREGVPPVRFDLEPFLVAGTLTYISGPPKSAKTWLALTWAICLVTKKSFCGITPQGDHRVLFLEAEYPRQIMIRVGQLCRAMKVKPETALQRIKFIRPRRRLRLEDPAQAAALLQAAKDYNATWIVIDSLRRVHGAEENSSKEMSDLADGALLPLRGDDDRASSSSITTPKPGRWATGQGASSSEGAATSWRVRMSYSTSRSSSPKASPGDTN